jgi:hypothetical protein
LSAADEAGGENAGLGPVSVVVCNYDGERHLPPCLDAVRELRGAVGEVLVVDNASTDGSRALVHNEYREARLIELEENRGPAVARNAGMRAAKHRWVLALDNDAVVTPALLEQLAAAAAADPEAAIVQPRSVFDSEPERVHYDGGAFHYAGLIALRNFYRPIAAAEGAGVVPVDCAIAVALLIDTEKVMALGGYDEGYFILFEDLDLSYRLRLAGARILSVEDCLVRHRHGTEGMSYREGADYPRRRAYMHSRNRWHFLYKCYRTRTLVAALPGLAIYELVWLLFTAVQGHTTAWVQGKRDFFRDARAIRAAREGVRETRRLPDRALLVGGPLTVTPAVAGSTGKRLALRALDLALRAWWALARPLAG